MQHVFFFGFLLEEIPLISGTLHYLQYQLDATSLLLRSLEFCLFGSIHLVKTVGSMFSSLLWPWFLLWHLLLLHCIQRWGTCSFCLMIRQLSLVNFAFVTYIVNYVHLFLHCMISWHWFKSFSYFVKGRSSWLHTVCLLGIGNTMSNKTKLQHPLLVWNFMFYGSSMCCSNIFCVCVHLTPKPRLGGIFCLVS